MTGTDNDSSKCRLHARLDYGSYMLILFAEFESDSKMML